MHVWPLRAKPFCEHVDVDCFSKRCGASTSEYFIQTRRNNADTFSVAMAISPPRRFIFLACFLLSIVILYNLWSSPRSAAPSLGYNTPTKQNGNQQQQFHPGVAKGASEPYTKTLVMARISDEDVSWVYDELSGFNLSIHTVDDPNATLTVPANKGHEAMAYLEYIIKNYDNLPDAVLFFHPHRTTWHNNILLDLDSQKTISRLNPAHVVRQGYFNARCHHDPGCPDWIHLDRPEAEWDLIKKKEEQWFTSKVWRELHPTDGFPKALSQPCCAQFAVSGERIRARPREQYEHYQKWLLNTPIEDEFSGRIMEYNWQYIFTGQSEFCPPQHQCYCDGYGICFGGHDEGKLQEWLDLLKKREKIDEQLDEWRERGPAEQEKHADELLKLEAQRGSAVNKIEYLKTEAYRRGEDPKARADECGRSWKEGDGY